ncbi:Nitronate monooxygenase [Lachnellula hyalina]|uniref:Nitronate monooxygenase n=1 Tax=Lachnellula hyalina TaxID=1316788 RepID=A0A8H8R6D0_9HELO|nr:Nitronate monooxygenase [Lachnellula hyalina]TVY29418.1 Nitronate monooxygenase [Lachnellula hyalina]
MPFNTKLTRALGIKGKFHVHVFTYTRNANLNSQSPLYKVACNGAHPAYSRRPAKRNPKMQDHDPKALRREYHSPSSHDPPDYGAYAQVAIDEGIKIVETAGNSPGPIIKQLKAVGIIILHKCTTIKHAQSAVKLGVDFLSIDGFECAGHVGETDITNLILLSRARQSIGIPFIASGGFADGQGLAAALSLGAEGINMGTRFMCTIEAPIHQNIKQSIVDAQETDTELVLRRWRNTSRLFKNKVASEAVKIEQASTTGKFEEVAPYVSGKRGREVFINGDPEFGVWTAGQVIGLIHDIPSCADLIGRIERDAEQTLNSASSLIVPSSKL